jgi:hypothetical protein
MHSPAHGQSDESAGAPVSLWQAYFRRVAGEYRLSAGDARELKLLASPVLKWSQPVRGGQEGSVYLWLDGGRPAVIGTFFIWPNGANVGVSHELHVLTSERLHGAWRERVRWRPADPALNWTLVEDAEASATSARRSIEARQLARRFAAKSTNRNGETSELRLQTRAFFEYQATDEKSDYLGGALFSLAHGTDTEVVVWLEAVRDNDKATWRFACFRMSDLALAVTLDGKEVWKTDLAQYNQFDGPYLCTAPEFLTQPPAEKP